MAERVCRSCGRKKDLGDFQPHSRWPGRYTNTCLECWKEPYHGLYKPTRRHEARIEASMEEAQQRYETLHRAKELACGRRIPDPMLKKLLP